MNNYYMAMFGEINFAKAVVPALIIGLFLGLLFILLAMTRRYKRIPPNAIGVVYGRKHTQLDAQGNKTEVGFKLVTGGGVFIMPIIQDYAEMSTEAFQIEIAEDNIPTKKNVSVHVAGVATCRISAIPEEQVNAVQNFLGKTPAEMSAMIREILRGHLRSIVGGLEVEELLRERSKFNEMVVTECSAELSRMGVKILTLVIQDVKDKEGYIDALGKQAVAGAKRDAQIAVAEAEKETQIKTSNAQREATEVKNQNDAKIAEAQKELQMKQAEFKKETETAQAAADMAGEIAKTTQEKQLALLKAERDTTAAEAQTKVQQAEGKRMEQQLQATKIVTAQADAKSLSIIATGKRDAGQIEAETRKNVATLEAETAKLTAQGKKDAEILQGQGEAQRLQVVAEAQAVATQKTKMAEAEGAKAQLLAQAEGEKAKLLAQADGLKASKLAEAEGTEALAEALKKLSEQGQLMMVLDRLPGLIDHGGDAGAKIAEAIFGSLGKSIEKMGPITITDLGGGTTAKNGMEAVGGLIPKIVTDFFVQAKGRGVDLTPLFKVLKMDPAVLVSMLGGATPKASADGASAPEAAASNAEAAPRA